MPGDDEDWFVPDSWYTAEADMFFNMAGGDGAMLNDDHLQMLFDTAYFEEGITPQERHDVREALSEYLAEEYDVDFDAAFDWEAYRDHYDSTH